MCNKRTHKIDSINNLNKSDQHIQELITQLQQEQQQRQKVDTVHWETLSTIENEEQKICAITETVVRELRDLIHNEPEELNHIRT